ncbi:acetyl-CoA C-acyltransferase [Candidatus Trichorickettsia mobilis]|nr:acetyl-CoA C-acyltransferase [Candidatus Trichorickettsia mobilis]
MNNQAVYITHAKRTAVGSLLSSLKNLTAPELGSAVVKSILRSSAIVPNAIDEVIMGQVLTGGAGQNPARQTSMLAGIPQEVPAFTVNKVCGSGLKTVCLAAQSIALGNGEVILAGGQENMSLGFHGAYIRAGTKLGSINMIDLMQYDGLTDVFFGSLMGITAENIAKKFNITRQMQDEFALLSHQKAAQAQKSGHFQDEIVPIEINVKKQNIIFNHDEGIRVDSNIEALAKLRPAFDPNGTVTAGNASTINDGAAVMMLASEAAIKKHNLTPLVRIVSFAEAGVDPSIMGTGPVPAAKKALAKAGWHVNDLDLIECNEAFAAQAIYVNQQLEWDLNKVNVNGGAIALGHPIGASGARVLVTLINGMIARQAKKGLATLCIGGGMGIAMCVSR